MADYILDISSEGSQAVSDLLPGQAILRIDASTNTASILCNDSAGDDITIPLGGAVSAFIADPAGGGTVDAEARAAIALILDLLIARKVMAAA